MRKITSICPYCGCGCKLDFVVENEKIIKINGNKRDEISEGRPCIKGLVLNEVVDENRILHPTIKKGNKLKRVSWNEALSFIYEKTKDFSPAEILFTGSGKITNEDNYAILKFAKIVYQTNNTDSCCGRLCHGATLQAMNDCFGNSNLTKMEYINRIDCLLIIGSNPASNYPVFFNKLLKRRKKIKIISVQTLLNLTTKFGDYFLQITPGTEIVLLNGIMNYLISKNCYSKKVEKYEGFERLVKFTKEYSIKKVCEICGIDKKEFVEISDVIANSKNFGIFHGMGFTQHINGIENVHSLLNLLLLKDGYILTLRGEVNVQGVGDIGFLPNVLPSGSFESISYLERIWKCKLPREKGKSLVEALLIDPVKVAFIIGFNPAQSMPNLTKLHKNLKKMFVVQIDSYFNLTSKFADVILPSPILIERNGTITNGERRIRVVKMVRKPLGESKPEWKIFKEFSRIFGKEKFFNYKNEKQIFKEIVKVVPAYQKVDVEKVYKGKDQFADKKIKFRRFYPEKFEGVSEIRSKQYPFILTTFRSRFQFSTSEMTRNSKSLETLDEGPCIYINEKDAYELKVKDREVVKISSRVASIKARIRTCKFLPRGLVAGRFHYENLLINKLFPSKFDEETFTPNYKAVAVRIEKI